MGAKAGLEREQEEFDGRYGGPWLLFLRDDLRLLDEAWSSGDVGECFDLLIDGRERSWSSWLEEDMFLERFDGWDWAEVGLERRALLDLRGWVLSGEVGGGGSSWDCLRLREDEVAAEDGC